MRAKKHRFITAGLSIFLPGSGQCYKGQKHKAILGYSFFFLLPILFVVFKLLLHFWGLLLFVILLLSLYFFNVADAVFGKIKAAQFRPRMQNKWLIIIPVILFSVDAYAVRKYLNSDGKIMGVRAVFISTASMAPTIEVGDFLIIGMDDYGAKTFERGGVIVFQHQQYYMLTKRVIAVPGDTIKGENNRIYLNGNLLDEPYAWFLGREVQLDRFNKRHSTADFDAVVVPEGKLFVMGDNRNNSYDSRDPAFGFVDRDKVKGRPLYIYWSKDKSRIGRRIE